MKSNIGMCVEDEGEHSTPIFISIALYKTGAAAATRIQPHLMLLPILLLLLFSLAHREKGTVLQGLFGYRSSLQSCNQSLQLIRARDSGGS